MPAVRTVAALLCLILASCGWCAVGHAQDRVTYSAHVGAGGSKAWNVIGGTAEFFPAGDHLSLFATGGLGTILVGGGIALYTARSDHGLIASATAGLAGSHVQLAGQVRVGPRLFATAGIGAGYYFLQHEGTMPFGSLEYRW